MKIGIIIETKEYEKAWNAFRFANTAIKLDHKTTFGYRGLNINFFFIFVRYLTNL